jgi:tetratricopeptide (TPR) repeat protein
LTAQGDIQAALGNYEDSLTIFRGLTKQDPTNRELQNNLAVIFEKTGEALLAQRDFSKALETFRDSLAICEKRTPDDLKNAEWASAEALAHLRIAMTLTQITSGKNAEVQSMLARARDILLDLKKRSALSASDQEHLGQIQTALANL